MTSVATVSPTGDAYVDGVLSGTKWGVTSLTYSFPTSASYYTGLFGSYGSGEPSNGFQAFNAVQQAATTAILGMYSSVSNLTFTQISETSTQSATLRYAESNSPTTAWTYYPSTSPEGGDAWFNASSGWYNNPVMGNYAWLTIIHETGHALGLKHPQDALSSFGTMPLDHDSEEYTVMSYRSYIGASVTGGLTNAPDSFPQSLMMYDIAAIQQMYGANYKTNSGNTVYSWSPTTGQEFINGVAQAMPVGNKIFLTVWDGGGNDTYDFSNYTTNLSVNLQPGGWTIASTAQLANLGAGHYAVGNIANALEYQNNPASLIENAIGGSGNDTIVGNAANNTITGGAGNDTIDGVAGTNTAVYSGKSTDYKVTANADGSYTVTDMRAGSPDGTDTLKNIEYLKFADATVAIGSSPQQPGIQAPSITSVSPDSGAVGDGITNANVLTLTGTGAAGSTVKVYDGAALIGSATVNTSGAWSFSTNALADGTHNFTATATDSAGNTSTASSAMNVIVDTVAPVTPTVSMQSVDSNIAGDHVTNVNVVSLTGTAEANSAIRVYDNGVLLGSAVANADGVWNFVPDLSGDQAAAPASPAKISSVVENARGLAKIEGTAAPNATVSIINAGTKAVVGTATADANGKWSFIDSHATDVHFAVEASTSLVTGAATTSNPTQPYSFTTAPLTDGVHNFTVTSTDAAGNVSGASTAFSVTIDTKAPNAPSIAAVSPDTGISGDGITKANVLTVTGSAEAGSTVKVYDGTTLLGSVVAGATGAWTFTTAALADGAHKLSATAMDLAGNVSGTSAALSVTVDTAAPPSPTITAYTPDTGVAGDGVTSVNIINISGAAEAGSTVKVYDGTTLLGTATANGTGAWTFKTPALTDGTHSISATATDAAGNVSGTSTVLVGNASSTALMITVDTVAPNAPGITSVSPDTGVSGDQITNANVLTVNGSAEANSTVKIFDGATLLGSVLANASGAWTFTTAALADGTHSLTATAMDLAGNISLGSAAVNINVDTVAPLVPTIASFSPDSATVGDGITAADHVTLAGNAEAGSTVKVYDGNSFLGSAVANSSGGWTFATGTLADGAHNFTATDTDVAGNTSSGSSVMHVVVDTAAPVVPTIASFSPDTATVGDGLTKANVLTLSGSGEAGSTVKIYDGSTFVGTTIAGANGAWGYTTSALSDGLHTFTSTDTDAAGNTSGFSAALHVTVDTAAPIVPTIAGFSPDTGVIGDGITTASVLTITGSGEANSTIKLYDGSTVLGTAAVDGHGLWSFTTQSLAVGAHSLTASDTDAAGNASGMSGALAIDVQGTSIAINATSFLSNLRGLGMLSGNTEAHVSLTINDVLSGKTLAQITSNSTGSFSGLMSGLTNTVHSFDLVAKDALGNAGVEHVVYGTTGNDVMSGTSANEVFTGRGGNDTFVFSGNFGKDTIADFRASADTIQLDHSAFADFASVLSHATQVGSDVVIAHDAQDSITLHNTVVSQLTSHNFHLV